MERHPIPADDLLLAPISLWRKGGLLLAVGDFLAKDYNCMTVGWGGFGVMWRKPIAMIVVRPTRYTIQFLSRFETFTLCAFPRSYDEALAYCGSHSGREGDKAKEAGLTATAGQAVPSPGFDEAELIVECRVLYSHDFDPSRFKDPTIESHYPKKDYHRMFYGEIVSVMGTPAWQGAAP
jgi:flavin reductase (DIM6/NTAB) family NADH-FMN oxidoreductase RutF